MELEIKPDALKLVSRDVEHGANITDLIESMFLLMDKSKGIGLAANQVGLDIRVIALNVKGFRTEIINPVITRYSRNIKLSNEGCLSFPNRKVKVKRGDAITVVGFDRDWNPIKKNCRGLLSYCVQHEIDHLNGITIIK